jgi:beta-glucosidase
MAKMTLDEKIGQLNLRLLEHTGAANSSNVRILKKAKLVVYSINRLKKLKKSKDCLKKPIKNPLLFGMDVIHGYETTFPIPLGLSCTWDMKLIERSAQIAAQEASADGINWTFPNG